MEAPAKAISQYLERYAEPDSKRVYECLAEKHLYFHQAMVIPAYKESEFFIDRLLAHRHLNSFLYIVVLNGPENISEDAAHQTLAPLRYLKANYSCITDNAQGISIFQHERSTLVCLDRTRQPIENKRHLGVGLARKLGMDCCAWLYANQRLKSAFVRTSDADVIWPSDYWNTLEFNHQTSAIIYPFEHSEVQSCDEKNHSAAALYDAWLRYYVIGLKWAKSPWAYHTIGSTLAINIHHYMLCRGFPKRQAGEDFYILNKLAKNGRIHTLQSSALTLSTRESDRTPFGTGSSITKIKSSDLKDWHFYHPQIFCYLKVWNEHQNAHFQKAHFELPPGYDLLQEALMQLGGVRLLQHCAQQSQNLSAHKNHMSYAFDAAFTRKLIHLLRDNGIPSLTMEELMLEISEGRVPFIPKQAITHPTELSYLLKKLETI